VLELCTTLFPYAQQPALEARSEAFLTA
jgi:hypothetical protein